MALPVLVSALLGVALLAASPDTAGAGGVKIVITGGHAVHHGGHLFFHGGHHFHHKPLHTGPVAPGFHKFPAHVHQHHVIVVPHPAFIVTSPPPCRWVPGYWTYQWIPQSYTQEVWVPGAWSAAGIWIGGHSELRTISGGYYQQVWAAPRCIAY